MGTSPVLFSQFSQTVASCVAVIEKQTQETDGATIPIHRAHPDFVSCVCVRYVYTFLHNFILYVEIRVTSTKTQTFSVTTSLPALPVTTIPDLWRPLICSPGLYYY